MNNEDQEIRASLQASQRQADGQAPEFNMIFDEAERQSRSRHRIQLAGLAAAAAIAVLALGLLPTQDEDFVYVDLEELTATTQWSAPSDSLLPQHQFDLYRDLPGMFDSTDMSTKSYEGALL